MIVSPYDGVPVEYYHTITDHLIEEHPLETAEIVDVVLYSWDQILNTKVGAFTLGVHIEPSPQIVGWLLHELIPLELQRRYPQTWKKQTTREEKDLVNIVDPIYSIEIKTSSSPKGLFGNRSYAQPMLDSDTYKKGRSGYYLAVNFDKVVQQVNPSIRHIRFGWLDHSDWQAQASSKGQAAHVTADAVRHKLKHLDITKKA